MTDRSNTAVADADAPPPESRPVRRPIRPPAIGLSQFGIPLGICGIAGVWTAAQTTVGATEWVADLLWIVAALFWAVFGLLYVVQRRGMLRTLRHELKHPIMGPFAAYVPVIGLLLLTHFGRYLGGVGPWAVWFFVAAAFLVAARLFALWLTHEISVDHLHPGYFLPVIAAAFVASLTLSGIRQPQAATGAFGIGVFFWIVIGTVVVNRLIVRGQLPPPLAPTLSVLLVPPAVGGIAWLLLHGGRADPVGSAFVGIASVLLVVQLFLLPTYLKIPVSMSYWTFTFPIAAVANLGLRWLAASPFPGSEAVAWVIVAVASVLIASIALVASLGPALVRRAAVASALGESLRS